MNSIHNNGQNDKRLSEDLDKLTRDYADLEQDVPPELLDQAILNSAHRALEKKPSRMKFGWVHGLTTAAVFVLALSLIINQRGPSPAIPEGIDNEYLSPTQLDARAGKQSANIQSDIVEQEAKEKQAGRSDMLTNAPAGAADDATPGTFPTESPETGDTMTADRVRQAEPATSDEADRDMATKIEEVVVLQAPPREAEPEKTAGSNERREDSAVAAAPAIEAAASSKKDAGIEQQIAAIIRLKQSGDERWKTELASFIEKYPDYPLPDELIN